MLALNRITSRAAELLGNRLLRLDAESGDALASFAGKVIHLEISDLGLNYYLSFPGGSLVVQESTDRTISASIRGKSTAFLAAFGDEHQGDSIFSGELHFSGEVGTAQRFQQLLQNRQLDWQQPISEVIGDELTALLAGGVRRFGTWVGQNWRQTQQDIPEYLQEEARVTPTQTELDDYFRAVDLLRSQTDRLQARIHRLMRHD